MLRDAPTHTLVVLALRGCPYSEEAAARLFPRVPRKVVWVSRAEPETIARLKRTYRHPTFPICLAFPTAVLSNDVLPRPPGVVKLGGLSDVRAEMDAAARRQRR